MLRLTQDKLPAAMRAEFAALISPEAIGITIGIIAVWAASHGTPVGPAVDLILLLIGIVALGWGVFEAASALYDFIAAIIGAKTERDLDRAAQHLARAISLLGVAAFAALLRKIGRMGRPRGKGGSKTSTKPGSPPPEPPPAIEVGRAPRSHRRTQQSREQDDQRRASPSNTVPDSADLPCFKQPPNATRSEFLRQLDEQQNAINNTDIAVLQQRRDAVRQAGGTGPLRDSAAQAQARSDWISDRRDEIMSSEEGVLPSEAMARALEEAGALDATHVLDIVAGGDPSDVSALANRSANRSIGSQWRSRVAKLDETLASQAKAGATRPNIRLKPC